MDRLYWLKRSYNSEFYGLFYRLDKASYMVKGRFSRFDLITRQADSRALEAFDAGRIE